MEKNDLNILITGSSGFIGKNLVGALKNRGYSNLYTFSHKEDKNKLVDCVKDCDFIFHLAGVNRPENDQEFEEGNVTFTQSIIDAIQRSGKSIPMVVSSTIQAELANSYGRSKKKSEELLNKYAHEAGGRVYIYRLPNVFGKWCRPDYNSVVATFCHRLARNQKIVISDRDNELDLVYIDDVVAEFIAILNGEVNQTEEICKINTQYHTTVGWIADRIKEFCRISDTLLIPDMGNELVKKLYSTYLSYLPTDGFSYPLRMNTDARGSFTEFIKTPDGGQVSINISEAGVIKGEHWHHSKNEKFLVVKGKGIIRLRHVHSSYIIEYQVSGDKLEVVDIPTGYIHNIVNTGDSDMITVMWANEIFDAEKPDTWQENVEISS